MIDEKVLLKWIDENSMGYLNVVPIAELKTEIAKLSAMQEPFKHPVEHSCFDNVDDDGTCKICGQDMKP